MPNSRPLSGPCTTTRTMPFTAGTIHGMHGTMAETPAAVRPAATIILCRPVGTSASFEVLLVKRHGKSGFMGGASVFPGGRVETTDADAAADDVARYAASIV